ncbi:MAG TPA: PAS domain S-box protein, partial [Anaeromyxobacteraceae bacterium]|nr:PAS domain S-box protein [Anaeromyxobacteraceae bacterium]
MALTTTPEVLREVAALYTRIAELERAHGMRPGEGAPDGALAAREDLSSGLHEVVAGLADGFFVVCTTAGEIRFASAAAERFLGWRPEQLVGQNAWAYVNQEDLAAMASARSAPLDDGIPIEVRALAADGGYRWLEMTARQWPKGEPRFVVLRYRDARYREAAGAGGDGVEERRLRDQLRRSSALARLSQLALGLPRTADVLDAAAALAASGLGVELGAWLEPAEGGLRVGAEAGFGPAARALTVPVVMSAGGLAHAGAAPFESADLARDPRVADRLLAEAGAGSVLAVPVRGAARAHGVLLVAARAAHRFEEEEQHVLETMANVLATAIDARAAQEALSARERLARAVFEHARDGMAIVDAEGRFVDPNPAMERLLGVSPEALRGRRPGEVATTDLDLSAAARAGRPQGEATASTPHGARTLEYDVVSEVLPGLQLAVLRDVTERRAMAARLVMADRLIAMGTLAAGVAHELNTPLAYVSANLEFLQAALPLRLAGDAGPGSELTEAVAESLEGTERLRTIIEDLRTFARAPAGGSGQADLEAVLRSCIAMTWGQLRHRAKLERDIGRLPPVVGNPARLAQVFVNLLVNAAQAIPPGHAQGHRIRLAARTGAGGRVTVEVSDTGAGIAPGVLPRIFEPFFTTKADGEGTGLGLSICRNIVSALGGTIQVESR